MNNPVWARGDREDFRNEAIFIVKHHIKPYVDAVLFGFRPFVAGYFLITYSLAKFRLVW